MPNTVKSHTACIRHCATQSVYNKYNLSCPNASAEYAWIEVYSVIHFTEAICSCSLVSIDISQTFEKLSSLATIHRAMLRE